MARSTVRDGERTIVAPAEGGMHGYGQVSSSKAGAPLRLKYSPRWYRWPIDRTALDRDSTGIGRRSQPGIS